MKRGIRISCNVCGAGINVIVKRPLRTLAIFARRHNFCTFKADALNCCWCRYGDHPDGPICPSHRKEE